MKKLFLNLPTTTFFNMVWKEKLRKISEYEWELPKSKPCMRVPARLFLSKKLLAAVEEAAIEQAANVACLPGVQKHVLAMPDMHTGYGFPIGGVAAISYESGGISPGGVGFDINCISGDSKILTRDGYKISISEITKKIDKIDLLSKNELAEKDSILFVAKRNKENRKIFKIETLTGEKLIASEDHPVLTLEGYKKVKEIKEGDKIIIYPFEGIEYEHSDEVILKEEDFSDYDKQIIKKLRENKLLPLSFSNNKIGIIARLFGYILGDGWITRTVDKKRIRLTVYISSSKEEDLEEIRREIKELGFKPSKVYKRKRRIEGENFYGKFVTTTEENFIKITSKSFAVLLEKLGMPIGKKTVQKFYVPHWIKKAPKWIKRNFLAGLFGAEMTSLSPYKNHRFNFQQPSITIGKLKGLKANGYEFLGEIAEMLNEFGVETIGIYEIPETNKTIGLRLVISNRPDSLINLYSRIGIEYNRKRNILGLLVVQYLKEKLARLKKREEAIEIIHSLKNQKKLAEIVDVARTYGVNKRFVERTLYGSRKTNVRIGESFYDFFQFLEKIKNEIGLIGFVPVEVVRKEEVEYDGDLWDMGVEKNRNFIANHIVLHNCGVRILSTNLSQEDVMPRLRQLLEAIFRNVPSGVGRGGKVKLNRQQLLEVLKYGAKWAVEHGYGWEKDLDHIEDKGNEEKYADPSKVSDKAIKRGMPQLGSLGAGNHFLEVQIVDRIFDPEVAEAFGIFEEKQITVMIHTGSRGLGHQVATDYLMLMEREYKDLLRKLPDRELAFAPSGSKLFYDYFAAMNAAANFAFANRQMITHWVRQSFEQIFGKDAESFALNIIYDIAHNMAKLEEHKVNGEKMKVLVHRKGATRAFGPKWKDVPSDYKPFGQPVLIPGSMGTASYILIGTDKAEEVTFSSIAHGAGRVMSRSKALRTYRGERVVQELSSKGISVRAASWKGVAEEAPGVYKDIDEVVRVCKEAGIAKPIVRLVPIGVVKG